MISAIVLAIGDGPPPERVEEFSTRSLAWLVSAAVAGVVRDVVFACPSSWPVADVMDMAGCALVRMDGEARRLAAAAALAKAARVLVIEAGMQPEGPLAAEVDAAERRLAPAGQALLLRAPETFVQRLSPDRAPVAGLVLPRERLTAAAPFAALVRAARGGTRLRTRLVPVL